MTATTTFPGPTSATAPATRRSTSTKSLWRTAAVSGVAASAATAAFAAGARALDVSLEIGGEAIPVLGFAQLTFVGAMLGGLIAVVLSHRASRPRHTFVVTTIALTALSIIPDVLADAQTATRITLALTHVIAAAIVIPAISSRLTD